jgi:hypothetical protein
MKAFGGIIMTLSSISAVRLMQADSDYAMAILISCGMMFWFGLLMATGRIGE